MAYEQKDGQGSLFKNKRKETDNHPDYTGSITLKGVEHWLSGWRKTPKNGGEPYMSLSVGKPKEQRTQQDRAIASGPQAAQVAKEAEQFDDDIPF